MKKSEIDEALVNLYLRLNGYFTTSLILHSHVHGQAKTEIDCLAIRHKYHSQDEREVETSSFLRVKTNLTDILICEVKGDENILEFNQAIRDNTENIECALKWIGVFEDHKVRQIASDAAPLFRNGISYDRAVSGIIESGIRVRALLCCTSDLNNAQHWRLGGHEIFSYIDECFNPSERRESCSTRYNFRDNWSYPLNRLVELFKSKKGHEKPRNIGDIYNKIA